MLIGFVIMLGGLVLGFPIYTVLMAGGLYVLVVVLPQVDPAMVAVGLFESINSFTLAAVPFFLLAGALMDRTSMSQRMVDCIQALVGNRRGGVALTGVLANELFGSLSGSSAAAVGAVGRVMMPMIASAHGEAFALGLLTSAGALAIIMPPSITMILYASAANVSTGELFLAGIIPAFIVGALLVAGIHWNSRHLPKGAARFSWDAARRSTRRAVWILMLPVVILGGIYGGIFTPTEAAAVSVAYALFVGAVLYRDISASAFKDAVLEAVRLTSQIFVLVAASAVFSQALTLAQIPQTLAQAVNGLSPILFLLVLNLVLLLVGMFFDPASAVLVLTPLFAPAAETLGIDLIHLGLVMTVNLAIGMFTPPFGLNLFVSQSVFRKPMAEIVQGLAPFWGWYLAALLIVTYLPGAYLWLPGVMR